MRLSVRVLSGRKLQREAGVSAFIFLDDILFDQVVDLVDTETHPTFGEDAWNWSQYLKSHSDLNYHKRHNVQRVIPW